MKLLCLMVGLIAAPVLLPAQVTLEIKLDQEQFLEGEALPVAVLIKNLSGQTLHLGAEPDWLTFSVESLDGFIVVKLGEVPVQGEFDLETSQVATRRVDLAPYFTLPKQGRYNLVASVRLKSWNTQIASPPKAFDVIEGATLWTRDFGVPLPPGVTNQPPEVRKFTLEQANYLRKELRLYLRLSDASGNRTYKVVAIGSMVLVGQPEAQLDKLSRLHVLYRVGPRTFSYNVFSPDGDLVIRQNHEYYLDSRPRLMAADDGSVVVRGGVRRLSSTDVPPPAKTTSDAPNVPKP